MNSSLKQNSISAWSITLCFMLAVVAIMLPELAAAKASDVSGVICNLVGELQGPIARGVAAFGIIFLGFSLFLGKISWGTALALGIGLGAIFGANQIVALMGAGTGASGDGC